MDTHTAHRVAQALTAGHGVDYDRLAAAFVLPETTLTARPGLAVDFPHDVADGKAGHGVIVKVLANGEILVRTVAGMVAMPMHIDGYDVTPRYTEAERRARYSNRDRLAVHVAQVLADAALADVATPADLLAAATTQAPTDPTRTDAATAPTLF